MAQGQPGKQHERLQVGCLQVEHPGDRAEPEGGTAEQPLKQRRHGGDDREEGAQLGTCLVQLLVVRRRSCRQRPASQRLRQANEVDLRVAIQPRSGIGQAVAAGAVQSHGALHQFAGLAVFHRCADSTLIALETADPDLDEHPHDRREALAAGVASHVAELPAEPSHFCPAVDSVQLVGRSRLAGLLPGKKLGEVGTVLLPALGDLRQQFPSWRRRRATIVPPQPPGHRREPAFPLVQLCHPNEPLPAPWGIERHRAPAAAKRANLRPWEQAYPVPASELGMADRKASRRRGSEELLAGLPAFVRLPVRLPAHIYRLRETVLGIQPSPPIVGSSDQLPSVQRGGFLSAIQPTH